MTDRDREPNTGRQQNQEQKTQRNLIGLLLLLVCSLICVSGLFIRYLVNPAPLPELIRPDAMTDFEPHYLFSIYGVDKPVGVGLSPNGDRLYVSESGGERLIRVFDRQGNLLTSFAPNGSSPAERSPVYLAVNSFGHVYVSDRSQHAIFIYDKNGSQVDVLYSYENNLGEHLSTYPISFLEGDYLSFNLFTQQINYQPKQGGNKQVWPLPENSAQWAPLGVRFSQNNTLYITDVASGKNCYHRYPSLSRGKPVLPSEYKSTHMSFGQSGSAEGQLNFPNVAMPDSQNRVYVSDGNNWRVSVWDWDGNFLYNFGQGTNQTGVSLPRGLFIDHKDRLYIADTVAHKIKVFDVSGDRPVFLFDFGELGIGDGLFQYPNDIVFAPEGRLYIADRENNRIQVWSY